MKPGELEVWLSTSGKPEKVKVDEVGGGGGVFGVSANMTVKMNRPQGQRLVSVIRERCAKNPFILIIDEAHTLAPEVARKVLNASQRARVECRFFLVLAGTPGLEKKLRQAGASFWDRSAVFPIGRLTVEESMEALVRPLKTFGIAFAPGAAEDVARRAHCYPFFVQVWGKCLTRRLAETGQNIISMDMVNKTEADVIESGMQMYTNRYNELKDRNLVFVAGEVARTFINNGNKPIHDLDIEKLIKDVGGEEDMRKTVEVLMNLGYIWQVRARKGTQVCYEPGISSLKGFVNEQTIGLSPPKRKHNTDMDIEI